MHPAPCDPDQNGWLHKQGPDQYIQSKWTEFLFHFCLEIARVKCHHLQDFLNIYLFRFSQADRSWMACTLFPVFQNLARIRLGSSGGTLQTDCWGVRLMKSARIPPQKTNYIYVGPWHYASQAKDPSCHIVILTLTLTLILTIPI